MPSRSVGMLAIPTDEGYSLLFSIERPEAFLEYAARMKRGS